MDYKDTLNLPVTDFPMKANLAVKELEILDRWKEMDLYGMIRGNRAGAPRFILHDGPPYANGNIHSGHALNKILKDIIVKAKTMAGMDAPYVPGWDCHGLPIEHMVDKQLGKAKLGMTPLEVRAKCREYAAKYVDIQREEFKRLGVLGDWERPYLTMNPEYEAATVRELAKFAANGGLYRGFKPVHWCPSCRTALAEAEVEYADKTSPSVYVKFKLDGEDAEKLGLPAGSTFVVIWTTTPWTIPANLAVCLHPDFTYRAVKTGGDTLIIAEDLVEPCMKAFGVESHSTVKTFKGSEMDRMTARHPFLDKDSLVINGTHVTLEQGTGCVHTAPGHGQEDYFIGLEYGLEVYNPVDEAGKFKADTPFFAGQKVWDANASVTTLLTEKGALLKQEKLSHSYPHCWRCHNPVIFRATAQWFISMETNGLRAKSLSAVRNVKWVPAWGEERIYGMVENRPDWCLSRQRAWGVPIIAFYCAECGEALLTPEVADHVAGLMEKEGVDIWFERPAADLLPKGSKCGKCGHGAFTQGKDILDVWFDSGVSHAIVMEKDKRLTWPADLYLEGSDQHRGWFHSSLLESVGTRGAAPYRQVLTHGYVVDGAGKKMSKSLGNTIAPQTVIDRYGAEIVRLWVASEDYRDDIRLSNDILTRLTEAYRKIRNTIRFMLGNVSDFDPAGNFVPLKDRDGLDRVIIFKFRKMARRVMEAYERYEFHVFYHAMHNFCVSDLSAFYLDIIKDRIYTYPKGSKERRAAQSTLWELLEGMLPLMAPVLSFTAEEAWTYMPGGAAKKNASVHLGRFPETQTDDGAEALITEWDRIIAIRGEVTRALESARKEKLIGHSLDAKLELSMFSADRELMERHRADLPFIFIVSQAALTDNPSPENQFRSEAVPGLAVSVAKADGVKCERCWNYSVGVGKSAGHPTVCPRCAAHLA
ncbi:MAG: isoleucine--tRNA ligase [Nitrospinae bacterium]|nr:isoleucine--tRNA ligase [Nitrospinota bacterium]